MTPQPDQTSWSLPLKFAFRFLFAYLLLYTFTASSVTIWDPLVLSAGKHLIRPDYVITARPAGSGDTTWNYLQLFCLFPIAVLSAVLWSILDRRRTNYETLHRWFRVYLRFTLAFVLISYGSVKIIQSQFPPPGLARLIQPFGDASPMGLLWTFMGASYPFNIYAGAGEMLGGVLLFSRRLTTLGALIAAVVMSQIVMLNFSYDVPVKLFSMHLLLQSLVLAAPDAGRLLDLLVRNRTVQARPLVALFQRLWLNRIAFGLKVVVAAGCVSFMLFQAYNGANNRFKRSPLYGIWEVEQFSLGAESIPPLLTDTARWRRIVFEYEPTLLLQRMSENRSFHNVTWDLTNNTFTMRRSKDDSVSFRFQRPQENELILEATWDNKLLVVKARRLDTKRFLLLNRGFHWINETPFNR